VSPELDEGIRSMRVAVLARLAERRKMYFDVGSIELLVKSLPDEEVWSSISHSNSGFAGLVRRFLARITLRDPYYQKRRF
jgi:hypothetical protein